MAISIDQARQYAANAGFTGLALDIIVAIAQAESNLEPTIDHTDPGGFGVDRGILQINSFWHPEVTTAAAHDPQTAFVEGFRISDNGTNFSEWNTFLNKAYLQTAAWKQYHNADGDPQPTGNKPAPVGTPAKWTPALSLKTWPWLTHDGATIIQPVNPWHSSFEAQRGAVQDGIGLPVPLDTMITSLTAGTVIMAAFGQQFAPPGADWNYGGFIIIRSDIPGVGKADVFYRHMDTILVEKNDIIAVGQALGLSGGQTSGGHNPESSTYSTGSHIDCGINAISLPYTAIGDNMDPQPWIQALLTKGPSLKDRLGIVTPTGGPSGVGKGIATVDQVAGGYGPVADSFLSIEQHIDASMTLKPFRTQGSTISNPVANWPIIGGIVQDAESPFIVADSVQSWLAGATDWVAQNTYAVMLRVLFVTVGLLIFVAFVFAMFRGVAELTGTDEAVKSAAVAAAA